MPRKRTIDRKTTISIYPAVSGWLEFAGRQYGAGAGEYINALVRADRAHVLERDAELAEQYRAFLVGTGADAELKALEAGEFSTDRLTDQAVDVAARERRAERQAD